ncbi:hypothetical protein KP509_18G085300 [Ceratopteris richardii]|uniref:Uncharacterized protein n=1 Tax=Ceratopteris richardii TaxID=49495 RepID=A0A8T2STG2_CERRI|nr:hypothetical protein KP509_18G085300 [Ceratopteris richardii]
MCFEVNCNKCGKTSWSGCGRHVQSVYDRVPEGQRCLCKSWPGVGAAQSATPTSGSQAASNNPSAKAS